MVSFWGILCTLLVSISSAHAYVPPSFYVVRMLARKHNNIEEVRLRHKVYLYKRNGDVARTFNEVVAISDAEHVTVRLLDEAGNELITRTRKLVGARAGDIERPVAYDLLLFKDAASIYEHFKALGLPLKTEADLYSEKEGSLPYKPESTVAFTRYENKVVVLVGESAGKPDSAKPATSLWVEKDSFLPVRAIFPSAPEAGMASEPLEYRMAGYQPYKNFLYPKTMQVYRNGTLWVKVETQNVKTDIREPLESNKNKAELDGDAREFVETYFKWVR